MIRLFTIMFTILIDQINDLARRTSKQNHCVGQVYVENEITQFSKRKLIYANSCEWCLSCIAPVNCIAINYLTFLACRSFTLK